MAATTEQITFENDIIGASWGDFDEDLAILDDLLGLEDDVVKPVGTIAPKKKIDPTAPGFGAGISPDVAPSVDEAEKLISQELAKMSLEEKKQVENEMRGMDPTIQEDHDFVQLQLEIMQARLDQMAGKNCSPECAEYMRAYRLSLAQDPEYTRSRSYMLMFLRASRYDPNLAANKLIMHMTEKKDLFGTEMLTKDLDMKYMTDDDREAMESDCVTILPFRSRNGRALIQVKPENFKHSLSARSLKRSYWFSMMAALRDLLTQYQGFICVVLHTGSDPSAYVDLVKLFDGTERYMPVKSCGALYFAENPACEKTVPLVRYYMSQACRTRFQARIGPMEENFEHLRNHFGIVLTSFKIPEYAEAALVEQSNYVYRRRLLSQHKQRLAIKQTGESTPKIPERAVEKAKAKKEEAQIITVLNDNDVLWGRGKSRDYIGNRRAQQIVEELKPRYMESDRYGKSTIVLETLQRIKERGGRFLRRVNDTLNSSRGGTGQVCAWIEQPDDASREKLGKFFRK